MAAAEEQGPVTLGNESLSPEDQLKRTRRQQVAVLSAAIVLDVALLALSIFLLVTYGLSLEPANLLWTGLSLACLFGVVPAVLLSLMWPVGTEHAFAGLRRTQYGYNVVFSARLLLGLLIVVNVAMAQYGPPHFDWTSDKVFTLASTSVNQVKALDKPVRFIALYPQSRPRQQLEELFELYENESDMVSHEFVDRFQQDLRTKELIRTYPAANDPEPVVIVIYGEGDSPEHKVIKHSEIFPLPTASDLQFTQVQTEFKGEDVFTSAVSQLKSAEKTNLYFTTGHGELALDNSDRRDPEGMGVIKERLEAQNITVESINLLQKEVSEDASTLVIAGPKVPFFPEEIQKIRDYLDSGGHLIAMVEAGAEMREQTNTGLESLLSDYNVEVKDNLAIDVASNLQDPRRLLVQVGGSRSSHSIVQDLERYQVILWLAREVKPKNPSPPPGMPGMPPGGPSEPYTAETLLTTLGPDLFGRPVSWAEADYGDLESASPGGEDDSQGPISLAVAVSKNEGPGANPHAGIPGAPPPPPKTSPVMVVFGDSSFVSNVYVGNPTNIDLFLNAVNWMRGRTELIGIQPRKKTSLRLTLTGSQHKRLLFGPSLTMLFLFGGLGAMVWIVRHRS